MGLCLNEGLSLTDRCLIQNPLEGFKKNGKGKNKKFYPQKKTGWVQPSTSDKLKILENDPTRLKNVVIAGLRPIPVRNPSKAKQSPIKVEVEKSTRNPATKKKACRGALIYVTQTPTLTPTKPQTPNPNPNPNPNLTFRHKKLNLNL